jgi:hypothetical protein
MRKSTMFISAVLTTFMLAVMFGVASAYQKIVQNDGTPTASAVQQVQPTDVVVSDPSITTGSVATITPEEAAALASSVIGRTDLYSAENSTLNGVDAYLVTFSSGDLVYVSLDGKILSISKLPVKYVLGQAASQGGGNGSGGGSDNTSVSAPAAPSASSNDGGGEHSSEHSDEHDGGDD